MKKKTIVISLISLFVLIAVLFYYFRYQHLPSKNIELVAMPDSLEATTMKEIKKLYNIPVDSFEVVAKKVNKNEILATILSRQVLPEGSLPKLLVYKGNIFDLRKIRAGNNYTMFLEKDSVATLRYFVYEHTPVEYVVFKFMNDSVDIKLEEKEITLKRKTAVGSIESSLWNAMIESGTNPLMANELSEIYAWSIDFFGLQKTDSFRVVYDEEYVDTISIGIGRVHAAYFRHADKDFYAIPFVQDSVESYYDLEGQSLRKAFLKAPLKYSRISSRFSNSRLHPVLKIRRPHHGVDYAAPRGTPVYAIGDGKIIMASRGYNRGGGNVIKIKHNSVYTTAYLHLYGFAKGIRAGKYVKQGELIAYVGSTGLSTGPHLDFRFYKNGRAIDPLKVEAPPVEPVKQENLTQFDSVKKASLKMLELEEVNPKITKPSHQN